MTIWAAMLGAFLLLLVAGGIGFAIILLVRLLVDYPVEMFLIVLAALFVLVTIWL